MESKVENTASPPPYTPPVSDPYHTAGGAANPYPAPAPAPGPTSYPPPGFQQYPPPAQYPAQPPEYSAATGQPPAWYPPQPGYATPQYGAAPPPQPQQQQQPQQQVVLVSAGHQQHPVIVQEVPSYVGNMVFACLVLWLCNWLFGLIAFILAVVASNTALSHPGSARRLGRASIGLSIAGIVITVLVIVIVYAIFIRASYCSDYEYSGTCYTYKKYVGSSGSCSGVKSSANYCYSNYPIPSCYEYLGKCYTYKKYVGSSGYCSGVKSGSYCYTNYSASFCAYYKYLGTCYKYISYVGYSGYCSGVKSGSYCYYN